MWVFESRVLGKTFGPEMEEDTGDWRKLYSEELYDVFLTRCSGMRRKLNVKEEEKCIQGPWLGNLKERDHLENLGVDGKNI
jgi:hypothetical protein